MVGSSVDDVIGLVSEPLEDHAFALSLVDPSILDEAALLDVIAATDRLRARVQSLQDRAMVAWDRSTMPVTGDSDAARLNHRWASDELGLVLGVSPGSASARVSRATTSAEKLPLVAADLRAGILGVAHAERLAAAARNVPSSVARDAEEMTLANREWRTPQQAEKVFTAAVLELDPNGAAERSRAARRSRGLRRRPEPDGMGTLTAFLPAADCTAVWNACDAHARSPQATNRPGDDRTLAERRTDALVELVTREPGDISGQNPTSTPQIHGRRIEVQVTVSWSTLVGLDDLPGDLTGYGPIDAATARRLAADPNSVWRRLLVDPLSGRLMDYGRSTYRPPQDLADHVIARDATCRFPGCEMPAVVCDLDHRQPFGSCGGTTCRCNTDPLCEHHHRLKQASSRNVPLWPRHGPSRSTPASPRTSPGSVSGLPGSLTTAEPWPTSSARRWAMSTWTTTFRRTPASCDPQYRRLIDDLRSGTRDAVVACHADRLHRSPKKLEEYIEVCETLGAKTRTVRAGALDLTTASGRAIARIHGAIARGESERMSERMRRGNRQRAEQGRPRTNGTRSYGYERDGVTIREDEAAVIRSLVATSRRVSASVTRSGRPWAQ